MIQTILYSNIPMLYWLNEMRRNLNEVLPQRWIRLCAETDVLLQAWPSNSPDFTSCDYFLWGYVKDRVYAPLLPTILEELRRRITAAVNSMIWDTLQRV